MDKHPSKRSYEFIPAVNRKTRFEPNHVPPLDQVTPRVYARLSPKQQRLLLGKLIEFLKTF